MKNIRRGIKWCNRCQRNLPYRAFYKEYGRSLGLSVYCKECKREVNLSRYHLSKESG